MALALSNDLNKLIVKDVQESLSRRIVAIVVLAATLVGGARAESLRTTADTATTRVDLCIGCFMKKEKLGAYLRWESKSDLDLHIFRPAGPNGNERSQTYYANSSNQISPEFGTLKCDDLGNLNDNICALRGEKFIIPGKAPRFITNDPDRPYCFVVRRYKPSDPTESEPWRLIIEFDGYPAFLCTGTSFKQTDMRHAETASDPRLAGCDEAFRGIDRNRPTSGVIMLSPLAFDFTPRADAIVTGPGAKCDPTWKGH